MRYDYIYDGMLETTLKCDLDDVILLEDHFINDDDDREEYNKVLYAIVEREKYFKKRFGCESKIIDNISDESLEILENMFISRIKDDNPISNQKNIDYLNELDKAYEEYFDSCKITKKLSFTAKKLDRISNYKIISKENTLLPKRFYILDEITKKKKLIQYGEYHGQTKEQVFDYFFIESKKGENGFYDHNLNMVFNNVSRIYGVDYKRGYILLKFNNDDKVHVFDKKLNEITSFSLSYRGGYIHRFVNDGILTTNVCNRVTYYDYLNGLNEIDHFFEPYHTFTTYGYSEGLYNFVDKHGRYGYKDLNRNIVIPPKLEWSKPFFNDVAITTKNYGWHRMPYYLDKNGVERELECEECGELLNNYPDFKSNWGSVCDFVSCEWEFDLDLSQQAYVATSRAGGKGCIIARNVYEIEDETPILKIDFDDNEKTKVKK